MARLLSLAAARGTMPAYVGKLLTASAAEKQVRESALAESASFLSPLPTEPLSRRELEVLRLLADGLSNQEIGERLFLALDTIKVSQPEGFRRARGQAAPGSHRPRPRAGPVVAAFPPAPVSRVPRNDTPNDTFVSTRRGAEWTYLRHQRITGGISWTPIWPDCFGGPAISREGHGVTLLTCAVVDQAALDGLLWKLRDLGLPLLSIIRIRDCPEGKPEGKSK